MTLVAMDTIQHHKKVTAYSSYLLDVTEAVCVSVAFR